MTYIVQRFGVSPFFRWYDLWIGAYWDRDMKVLYVCPVPMFGLKVKMPWRRLYRASICRQCDGTGKVTIWANGSVSTRVEVPCGLCDGKVS